MSIKNKVMLTVTVMQKKRNPVIPYIVLIAASALFMLLFAYNTSPLTRYFGVDSGMYLVMGKAMAQGETLYSSIFDHKGPVIFIINMLPQLLIDGTIGVWLTELCLITISAVIVYKTADRHLGNALSLCVPFIYTWITVTLFNGGNYTEEYSNFFCVLSLYVFDKWQREKALTPPMPYILGLCFALVFFMRPNNVAFIVSVILSIGIPLLLKNRDKFRSAIIWGFLGVLTVTLPLVIYHLCTGTLYDMFYATVLHNLKYCAVGTENFHLIPNGNTPQLLCFFIALAINIVAMCTCYSSNETKSGNFILLGAAVISSAILIGRHPYMYYWTLLAPITAYSSIFIIKYGFKIKKRSISLAILTLILALMCTNSFWGTEIAEKRSYITEYKSNAHQLYDMIPISERDDCFAYDIPAIFIYEVDLITPCKYFTMQTWMSKINPDIAKYCTSYVKENEPKWILSYFQWADKNPELSEILRTGYIEVFDNDIGYLYRKADGLQ